MIYVCSKCGTVCDRGPPLEGTKARHAGCSGEWLAFPPDFGEGSTIHDKSDGVVAENVYIIGRDCFFGEPGEVAKLPLKYIYDGLRDGTIEILAESVRGEWLDGREPRDEVERTTTEQANRGPYCGSPSQDGRFFCSRRPYHHGDHIAVGSRLCARWQNETDERAPAPMPAVSPVAAMADTAEVEALRAKCNRMEKDLAHQREAHRRLETMCADLRRELDTERSERERERRDRIAAEDEVRKLKRRASGGR